MKRPAVKRPKRPADPVLAYAEDVGAGHILAGPWVRLACERHLRDLEMGPARGLVWDLEAALHAIHFFPRFLHLPDAGTAFELQPWQQFIVGSVFGWKTAAAVRRFRTIYVETGKGSGKTPLLSGVGLYGLLADGESAAEIYSAATTAEQASILWRDAARMVDASPALAELVDRRVANLAHLASGSFFRAISSEHRGLDGKRVHMGLLDEIHEHPDSRVVDKIRAGTKGRRQALIFEITNAGYDKHSICWQHHEYSEKVLRGLIENDTWFGYVCALDEKDDWRNPNVWLKCNPNLGVSIQPRYLQELVEEAEGMPAKANIVKRLNFCIWTEQASRWIEMDLWDDAEPRAEEEALAGLDCYAGLDLASISDLAALVLVFPRDGGFDVLPRFWCPEEGIRRRSEKDGVPYQLWVEQGYLTPTEGEVIDHDRIREDIRELAERYHILEVGFDRWGATQLRTQLEGDGLTMVDIGQGFASMSAPSKEFERAVKSRAFRHGENPILRWMASNVAAEQDAAGNVKPSKKRSGEKIDGIVAAIMALDRATRHTEAGVSVYETEGVFVLG